MVDLFYLLLMATACCGFDKLGAFQFRYFVSSSAELDPVYGVRLDSTVPAVNLALEYITNNSTLLPGITLNYGQAASQLQCPVALDDLPIDANVGILGYSCSEDTYNTNSTTGIFNLTPMIQYTAAPVDDAFNSSETLLFSIHPSPRTYAEVLVSIIKRFGWQRIVTVTNLAGERFFIDVLESITLSLRIQDTNITLFKSDIMNSTAVTGELLTLPLDVRIVFLNVNSSNAVQIMCNASRAGHLFPHYVWIAYAGDYQRLAVNSTCGSDELAQFLEGVFTLLPTLSNETDQSFLHLASRLSYFAFDAVLVLAQALNDTLTGWSSTSTDCSFCEPASEQNMTLLAKCCIRQKIQNVNVSGVTGEIQFNLQGNRITQVVGLHQYRFQGTTTFPASEMIAVVRVDASSVDSVMSEFELLSGENETTIFNGPIPPDGTPLKHINAHPLSFVIVYYIIAAGGILFALVCLLFNIIFRKRKIVRLTSPNLNYFTILGSLMLYSLVYIRIYSNATAYPSYIRCILERVLINVGYMLCFAPVLMKMCRVYYIFHNPSPVKKAIKDWHLFLGTAALVAIIIVLLVIGIGTPMFRGVPKLKRDPERPEMATEDGIRVENFIYQCYGLSVSLAWVAIEYLYLVSLQVAAFVLAILTRKVKIKVLNDSKEMMIVVYSTSTIMLVVGVLTFAFDTRLILDQVIFCGLVMVATSVFLTFVYIPKMIDLYRDPRGEGVFGGAHDTTTHQAEVPASTNPTFLMHDKAGGK